MKFKSQDKQNQLIEKITAQHLVVGIDIAQQMHVARAVNFRGLLSFWISGKGEILRISEHS
ncbi:hypothetical protein LQV63_25805 [Paenibacillus profundus]|uniref:IS110 family transposase n=1 Tax=Paenibacillus profundus TaxID=1173085 RepID=A0ABS8YQF0_9BACL|nr:hypothetical protein [Paenibacillus profundus]MCE5172688.1 hypothetical protein [Paenibacillus profundus]